MINHEQLQTVKKLSDILGKSEQEIMNTPYEKIIRLLVDRVEDLIYAK